MQEPPAPAAGPSKPSEKAMDEMLKQGLAAQHDEIVETLNRMTTETHPESAD
jgi:hypothetical protein